MQLPSKRQPLCSRQTRFSQDLDALYESMTWTPVLAGGVGFQPVGDDADDVGLFRFAEDEMPEPGDLAIDRMAAIAAGNGARSEEHTSELQSLMRISYAVFC